MDPGKFPALLFLPVIRSQPEFQAKARMAYNLDNPNGRIGEGFVRQAILLPAGSDCASDVLGSLKNIQRRR